MIKKRNQPITGARPEYSRKRPLVPEANDTSANAQVMIDEAPSPFKNRMQVPQIPAPTNPSARANSQFEKDGMRYGGVPKRVGVASTGETNYAASGDWRPAGYNSVNSGFPQTGNQRMAGRISTNAGPKASATEQKALRSMGKIGLDRAYLDFKRFGG